MLSFVSAAAGTAALHPASTFWLNLEVDALRYVAIPTPAVKNESYITECLLASGGPTTLKDL